MENQSSMVLTVILALVVGGLAGYFVGMQQGHAKALWEYQAGIANPTANGMGTGVTAEMDKQITQSLGTPIPDRTTITLTAQSSSGQNGSATLSDENGKVKVVLALSGGTIENPQPAHIHLGSCPDPGDVVFPLTDVVDGKSETVIDTTMADLKAKGALAINVHKSKDEMKIYTACGDIK